MTRLAGTVVEVRDGRAWIECAAGPEACGACASGQGCGFARRPRSHRLAVPADQAGRPLEPGEGVEIEADERLLLAAALRLYLPPLAGLLAGPLLLRWSGFEAGLLPLVAAVIGVGAGSVVARSWVRRVPPVTLHRA